jgi:hypothetical protein
MPTCPKGHDSAATDYCDECGTPIGGPSAPAPPAGPAGAPVAGPATGGEPCPACATPRAGRFCEVCGHDFVAAGLSGGAGPAAGPSVGPSAGAGTSEAGTNGTVAGAPGTDGAPPDASQHGTAQHGTARHGTAPNGTAQAGVAGGAADPGTAPAREPAGAGWRVTVAADPTYHARMQAAADAEVEPIAFPAFCPERRFTLRGDQVLIGRQSRSRGIEPDIDLTGPPTDPAVSHAHAMLVSHPEGGWALVDLGSANGTYLNDGAQAIEQNVRVPLSDGDRIHVGAFSTLTLRRA